MHFPSFGLLVSVLDIASFAIATAVPRAQQGHDTLATNVVHQFPKPDWIENIRVRQNGQSLVTVLTSPELYLVDPQISSLDPESIATANLVHNFTSETGLLGITEVKPDQFFVVAGRVSLTNLTEGEGTFAVWSVDMRNYDSVSNTGAVVGEVASFPESGLFNGMDTLDASQSLVVIADSEKGVVWLLNVETGEKSQFLQEPEMALSSAGLGINGLKVLTKGDTAYLYFSAGTSFYRIPVSLSTLQKAGSVEVLQNSTVVDDFALDEGRNVAFLAATDLNALLSIPLTGGNVTTILGGVNETVLATPTSVTLGRGPSEKDVLFVTTHGPEDPVTMSFTEGGKIVGVDISNCF